MLSFSLGEGWDAVLLDMYVHYNISFVGKSDGGNNNNNMCACVCQLCDINISHIQNHKHNTIFLITLIGMLTIFHQIPF